MNGQMHVTGEQTDVRANENISMDTSNLQDIRRIDGQISKLMAERDEAVDVLIRELQNRNEVVRMTLEKEKQDLERRLNDIIGENTTLNDRLSIENENNDKYQAEIASIKEEKNLIESELVTLRQNNETVIKENNKLADDIQMTKEKNERMANEIKVIEEKLKKREDELNEKTAILNDKERNSTKIFRSELKKLNDLITDKQQQNESLRMENKTLKKRLSNTNEKMEEEKEKLTVQLTTVNMQWEFRMKNLADRDKENIEEIVRLASENEALKARCNELNRKLINTTRAEAATMASENSSLDAGLTSDDNPTAANIMADPSNQSKTGMKSESESQSQSESETEVDSNLETEMESESEMITSKQTKRHIDEDKSDDKVNANVNTVPTKRQMVAGSKLDENIADSPNSTRTAFLRFRPIENLLKNSLPQKNDAMNKTSSSASGNSQKSGSFKWRCNCSALFDEEKTVKKHLLREHHYATDDRFECVICGHSDNLKVKIETHLKTEHNESDWKKVKRNYNYIEKTSWHACEEFTSDE